MLVSVNVYNVDYQKKESSTKIYKSFVAKNFEDVTRLAQACVSAANIVKIELLLVDVKMEVDV